MSTSFIIPAWNGIIWINPCLESLHRQSETDDEIIVVDNGSTDGTADEVALHFPAVNLVRLTANTGFAGAVNVGLRAARGDVLVWVNQDVVLQENCVTAVRQRLACASPAIVGAKLLYPDGRTIQHAGGFIHFPRGEPGHYGYREIDEGQFDEARPVDYVTGALLAFPRQVLNAVGLLDEGFFPANYEEVDYCFRARAARCLTWYEPAAVAVHHESQTQEKRSARYHQVMERNRLRFVLKHWTPAQWQSEFFPAERTFLQLADRSFASAVLAPAYRHTLLHLPDLPWLLSDAAARRAVLQALSELWQLARGAPAD